MGGRSWSDEDCQFLRDHYSSQGSRWCAKRLKRSRVAVCSKAQQLGLKRILPPRPSFICKNCGGEVERHRPTQVFCDLDCRREYWAKSRTATHCGWCDKQIKVIGTYAKTLGSESDTHPEAGKRFCNWEHYRLFLQKYGRSVPEGQFSPAWKGGAFMPCENCGKLVWVQPSDKEDRRTCSIECRVAVQKASGELLNYTDEELLQCLRDWARKLGRAPTAQDTREIPELPYHTTYKKRFGSWTQALGLVGLETHETYADSQIAQDGHRVDSLQEKIVDDWLYRNGIEHQIDPLYPGSDLRADWKVAEYFVEYWGLVGIDWYDEKIAFKRRLAREHDIRLVELYPEDLDNLDVKLRHLRGERSTELKQGGTVEEPRAH